jgi:hypothetical protein
MTLWAAMVLFLALVGTVLNLTMGTPIKLVLHDILLFLVALGILIRIRSKVKEGEKEALEQATAPEASQAQESAPAEEGKEPEQT